MAVDLTSTYGIWLVSLFLETILYGCGLLQAWLYFQWYQNDHWGIRSMVSVMWSKFFPNIEEMVPKGHTAGWIDQNFHYHQAQLSLTYLSEFLVQMYFATCIYRLNKAAKILPALVAALALTQLIQDVVITKLGSFTNLAETAPTYALQSAATLACDLLITGSLLYRLNNSKTELSFRATNSMLDRLMINAVNRGGLTALAAALNLFLFVALPNTLWFLIGLFLSSKLYMNSALASLNSRQYIRDQFSNTTIHDDWRVMDTFQARTSTQPAAAPGRAIQTFIQEDGANSEEHLDTKKKQLVSDEIRSRARPAVAAPLGARLKPHFCIAPNRIKLGTWTTVRAQSGLTWR
ncbi:hypothetical protein CVT24_003755 [Panaeolus cyanescens]|uniref:DUF6534 domain-containing protein n=1 Tax=Panaeolus cyanescens TaxID=181874 RepID=A0A409YY99_9AGAR|nr:hypothetical protein CVT24_003755 [Panaeolus cyanescens]